MEVDFTPVAVLVTVRLAPGTNEPVLSVTTPVSSAALCAQAAEASSKNKLRTQMAEQALCFQFCLETIPHLHVFYVWLMRKLHRPHRAKRSHRLDFVSYIATQLRNVNKNLAPVPSASVSG